MNIQRITNSQNFEGMLITSGNFSNKPNAVLKRIRPDIEKLIKQKDFDILVKQDYSTNEIKISAGIINSYESENTCSTKVSTSAKSAKYVSAVKNAITLYEKNLHDKEQLKWEQEYKKQKKESCLDFFNAVFIGIPIICAVEIAEIIHPKLGKKVAKIIDQKIL